MRDIIFKALTSAKSKKRDLCIQETVERNGVLARTERRCRYFVMNQANIDNVADMDKLAASKFSKVPYKKRHFYVLKIHDKERGEDKLLCKMAGMFYAVHGARLYCIAYVHSFKVIFGMLPASRKEKENDIF